MRVGFRTDAAPRDGSEVDLLLADGRVVVGVYFNEGFWINKHGNAVDVGPGGVQGWSRTSRGSRRNDQPKAFELIDALRAQIDDLKKVLVETPVEPQMQAAADAWSGVARLAAARANVDSAENDAVYRIATNVEREAGRLRKQIERARLAA